MHKCYECRETCDCPAREDECWCCSRCYQSHDVGNDQWGDVIEYEDWDDDISNDEFDLRHGLYDEGF